MHENSLKAFAAEHRKLSRRESEVLGQVYRMGSCTDRMVKDCLGYSDMNTVRPRITELLKKGLVEEAGDCIDKETGRHVRIVRIKPAPELQQAAAFKQDDLFLPEDSRERAWGF